MRLAFLAHPLRGDVPGNLARARQWYRWMTDHMPDVAFVCQWVIDCEVYDDGNEGQRADGIRRNLELVSRCDVLYLVGGQVTPGMAEERTKARLSGVKVVDLTGWGDEPPACYGCCASPTGRMNDGRAVPGRRFPVSPSRGMRARDLPEAGDG